MTVTALPTIALCELLRSMADDEFVIGFSDSEWTGIAPLLEEDVAISSLAQDELGHAAALYELLSELTGEDRDALAYDRLPADYRHCRLLDHGRGDWAMTIARRYLYDTADAVRLAALAEGSWQPLTDLTAKLIREERYHQMHMNVWLERLARGPKPSKERLEAALATLGPDAGTVFAPMPDEDSLVVAGILAAPMSELEGRWRDAIAPTFSNLGLALPPPARDPNRGRRDHGEAFSWLWTEFNSVRSAEPGAVW
jgi:ring-1,2-phenylacetyl-CoA epoxidase subunit PaaC